MAKKPEMLKQRKRQWKWQGVLTPRTSVHVDGLTSHTPQESPLNTWILGNVQAVRLPDPMGKHLQVKYH